MLVQHKTVLTWYVSFLLLLFVNLIVCQGMPGIAFGEFYGTFWGSNMVTMVNNGTITVQELQDKALRILTTYYHLGCVHSHFTHLHQRS